MSARLNGEADPRPRTKNCYEGNVPERVCSKSARRIAVGMSYRRGDIRKNAQTASNGSDGAVGFCCWRLGAIVLAFMGLSLAITATGTARFAVAMGYRAEVGYAVGAVFDLRQGVAACRLTCTLARRAFLFFVIIGFAWLGLVTYSALATQATVSTAIAAIERNGSWKTEERSGIKAELAAVEKRLDVLSQPVPPRPTKSLIEALAVEKVPPGVWRDSRECQSIRDSKYFQSACTKVLNLRRELAAAKDYEQLDVQAGKLRQALAGMPLVATSDPLPEAFAATLGRLLPLDGRVGVSLLLTFVIEIMSCFGLAALRVIGDERTREAQSVRETQNRPHIGGDPGIANRDQDRATEMLPQGPSRIIPGSSLTTANVGISSESQRSTIMPNVPRMSSLYTGPSTGTPSPGTAQQRPPFDGEGLSRTLAIMSLSSSGSV